MMTQQNAVMAPFSAVPRQLATTDWTRLHLRQLAFSDTVIVFGVTLGAQAVRDWWLLGEATMVKHSLTSVLIAAGWLIALKLQGSRDPAVIGDGVLEFRRILNATVMVFGLFAIWCLLAGTDLGRGYMLLALPVGGTLLVLSRAGWRFWLRAQRTQGKYMHPVVLVGSPATVGTVASELGRHPEAGYQVRAVCVSGGAQNLASGENIEVEQGFDDVLGMLERVEADTVVVTGSDELPAEKLRDLSWRLADARYQLVVAPGMTDVGAPRVTLRPVSGLPLMHVESRRHDSALALSKRVFDVVISASVLAILSVPMLIVALVIKATSAGPVFYRQERIGLDGQPFQMVKFRSMRSGADAELEALLREQNSQGSPLFKVADDPRITRIGGFIRKYSIDELPQLLNVLAGDMSLVGPRPQVSGEVALYDVTAHRRHIVKPGMTGLWQVSGRSSLSWNEAIRLDLFYVQNWSVATDLGILLKTFRAVITPGRDAH